ncbi:molybdopterin adenylyltransferase [soil metagenome]
MAILTCSDRCARGVREDVSGPTLARLCVERLGAEVAATAVVSDEVEAIATKLFEWSRAEAGIDLVLSTGGTGLAPRDVTPEAAGRVIERPHAGLMELARLRCYPKTVKTYMSRGVAGAAGRTLIITLPGSVRGCSEMFEALEELLAHAVETVRGDVVDG